MIETNDLANFRERDLYLLVALTSCDLCGPRNQEEE